MIRLLHALGLVTVLLASRPLQAAPGSTARPEPADRPRPAAPATRPAPAATPAPADRPAPRRTPPERATPRRTPPDRPATAKRPAPARPRHVAHPVVVLVSATPVPTEIRRLAAEIRDHLVGTRTTIRLVPVPRLPDEQLAQLALSARLARAHHARLVFWWVTAPPPRLVLFHPDAEGGRLVVRPLRRDAASEASRLATVAAIVRSQITALDPPPLPRIRRAAPPPAPRPPPRIVIRRPAPPPHRLLSGSLALAYELALPGRGAAVWHAAAVGFRLGIGPHWGATLGYGMAPAFETSGDNGQTTLRFNRHAVRAGASYRWRRRRMWIRTDLGAELGIWQREAAQVPDGLTLEPAGVDLTTDLWLTARIGYMVARRLSVYAELGVWLALVKRDYVRPDLNGGTVTIFAPWPIKPVFSAGLLVELF